MKKHAIQIRVQLMKKHQQIAPCLEESEDSSEKKQSRSLSAWKGCVEDIMRCQQTGPSAKNALRRLLLRGVRVGSRLGDDSV